MPVLLVVKHGETMPRDGWRVFGDADTGGEAVVMFAALAVEVGIGLECSHDARCSRV